MIHIDNTIVSDDLLDKYFVCDLNLCKGICCIEGDAGAPLEEEEISILEDILEEVKPYMTKEGLKAVEKTGVFDYFEKGELGTALIKGKECVFVCKENGICSCAIELAYKAGKIKFQKPISCYLYPIRIKKFKNYDAVNYDRWHICKDAIKCGKKTNTPVFKFLEEPLIKKYGRKWFKQLEKKFLLLNK